MNTSGWDRRNFDGVSQDYMREKFRLYALFVLNNENQRDALFVKFIFDKEFNIHASVHRSINP